MNEPWYYSRRPDNEGKTLLFGFIVGFIIGLSLFFLILPKHKLDANGDGQINIYDAMVYEQYLDEIAELTPTGTGGR